MGLPRASTFWEDFEKIHIKANILEIIATMCL